MPTFEDETFWVSSGQGVANVHKWNLLSRFWIGCCVIVGKSYFKANNEVKIRLPKPFRFSVSHVYFGSGQPHCIFVRGPINALAGMKCGGGLR